MIEHFSEFVPDVDVLRCVTLPAVPNVYGLEEPDQRVAHWVFALPGGQAYIVSSDEEGSGAMVLADGQIRRGCGYRVSQRRMSVVASAYER
jgi:hypothetical protein